MRFVPFFLSIVSLMFMPILTSAQKLSDPAQCQDRTIIVPNILGPLNAPLGSECKTSLLNALRMLLDGACEKENKPQCVGGSACRYDHYIGIGFANSDKNDLEAYFNYYYEISGTACTATVISSDPPKPLTLSCKSLCVIKEHNEF